MTERELPRTVWMTLRAALPCPAGSSSDRRHKEMLGERWTEAVVVHTVDPAALMVMLLVINSCTIGGVSAVYTYLSEQYPTEIRTTAISLVNAFSRIALASGAVVVGPLIERVGPQNAFTLCGASFALAGLILVAFGVEMRGKTLEEIQAGAA